VRSIRGKLGTVVAAAALVTAGVALSGMGSPKNFRQGEARAGNKRPVLVELFTSEGCSSCPPADDLLRQIDGKTTNEGALIIGLSEHVTYWDHDGWKDPYDSDEITSRQNDYGQRFHIDSVYTPQMVVNGETQVVGSDGKGLLQAILKAEADDGPTVNIVSTKLDGNSVDAVVSVAGEISKHGAEVYAVVAHDETTAHVLRGENKGKTLMHASVARTSTKATRIHAVGETTMQVALPNDIAASAGGRRHLVVWVQEPNAGRVLGVDSKSF
jgi:hypothetical protein